MPSASTLKSFFEPRSIAVAGASADPDKLGSIIFSNLLSNRREGRLSASVYPVNPSYERIGEERCYPDFHSLPERPELVILAVPSKSAVGLAESAAKSGAKALIVISGGYSEVGRRDEEEEMGEVAREHGMRILGPNTIGLVDTVSGVDSLFIRPTKSFPGGEEVQSVVRPLPGAVAVITQSGYLGEAISSELASRGVGVRAIVGTGNQLDVSVEDVMEYFSKDPRTDVVAVYLEGARDGRRFMCAALGSSKAVVVFKAGKTGRGADAALTHTGSIVGSYDAYRAAFRRAGVIEARTLQELVDFAVALRCLPSRDVRRLAIVTNAGGVGAIAADEAVRAGLEVGPMKPSSGMAFRRTFGGAAFIGNSSLGNPIDLTASVSSDEFLQAASFALGLPEFDGAVVLPTHQAPGMKYDLGEKLAEVVAASSKPVSLCIIGEDEVADRIRRDLAARGIPSFPTPERAVRAILSVAEHARLARKRVPLGRDRDELPKLGSVGLMERDQVSLLLRRLKIREPKSVFFRSPGAARFAGIRFPVACKLAARGLVHKTEAGGVVLGVRDPDEAREAAEELRKVAERRGAEYLGVVVQEMVEGVELLLGATRDPTFGATVTLGLGGIYAELMEEPILAVAPAPAPYIRSLIKGTKIERVLRGYRGGPRADMSSLCRLVSSFSRLLPENPAIVEAEVNPLTVSGAGIFAVDARVVVGTPASSPPRRKR